MCVVRSVFVGMITLNLAVFDDLTTLNNGVTKAEDHCGVEYSPVFKQMGKLCSLLKAEYAKCDMTE